MDSYRRYELGKVIKIREESELLCYENKWLGFSESSVVERRWVRPAEDGKLVQER